MYKGWTTKRLFWKHDLLDQLLWTRTESGKEHIP